jgi:hypothetical protein
VKLDKLTKQLRRDLAANPKKAAALGLMGLVALYFWLPLVWRWISPEGGTKPDQSSALILKDDPEEPAAQAKRRGVKFHWDKVRQLIVQDARMVAATYDVKWTDPFAGQAPKATQSPHATGRPAEPAALNSELEPQQAGLVLSSVMIGAARRTATINGDTYREGSLIKIASKESTLSAIEFHLTRITSQGVELERNGKRFVLLFARPALAEGDQIERTGANKID